MVYIIGGFLIAGVSGAFVGLAIALGIAVLTS